MKNLDLIDSIVTKKNSELHEGQIRSSVSIKDIPIKFDQVLNKFSETEKNAKLLLEEKLKLIKKFAGEMTDLNKLLEILNILNKIEDN